MIRSYRRDDPPGNDGLRRHYGERPLTVGRIRTVKTVTSAYEIMGGPATGITFTSYEKFRSENPRVFAAVGKAFDESFDWINFDKRRAAKLYIEMTKEKKLTEDELTMSISGKDMEYTKVPTQVGRMVEVGYPLH